MLVDQLIAWIQFRLFEFACDASVDAANLNAIGRQTSGRPTIDRDGL
jgi:hypothetical protein